MSGIKKVLNRVLLFFSIGLSASLCAVGCTSYFDDNGEDVRKADIIMTVSHETVYLRYGPDGDGPAECILVMDEDFPDEWRPMLCGEIDGFEYELGYEYTLRVRRTFVESGHGATSSIEYQLVEVLHKEHVEE